ncbi:flagellar brake protein [Paraliobacillus sp. JSM ZJ581]|uniref:flagellar brake protein n=1 Tax=Paraliobacillus sp. JSM ZJ581 TaxID=3342118 RepID=UPI0035A88A51
MIKIGMTLRLQALEEEESSNYRSKVVEQEGSTIYIDYPINETTGRTNIFPKGTTFNVSFVDQSQTVYQFKTEIIGKKMGKIPMLMIYFSQDDMIRIQRREYVRVNSALDISIHDMKSIKKPFHSITTDISGGGLCALYPIEELYHNGDVVDICVVLPMENERTEYIMTEASVIRIFKKDEADKPLLTLEFKDISERDRQLIIRHCFETQLKNRRREL